MVMKKQFWNLHFGSKAFIFSLDVVIAIVVVMALLVVSTFYVAKAGSESVAKLQMIRVGSDVLALLDHTDSLDSLFVDFIEIDLNTILPANYHMRIKVYCEGEGTLAVETTDTYPSDRFIGVGERVFVTDTYDYCMASYNIWLR